MAGNHSYGLNEYHSFHLLNVSQSPQFRCLRLSHTDQFAFDRGIFRPSLLFYICFSVSLESLNTFGLIFWSCPLTFSALFTITPILSRNYLKWLPAIHIWCKIFFSLDGINQSQSGSALLKHLRTKTFQLNARKVNSWLSTPIVGWTQC